MHSMGCSVAILHLADGKEGPSLQSFLEEKQIQAVDVIVDKVA